MLTLLLFLRLNYLADYFVNYSILYDFFNISLPHVFFVDTHVFLKVSIAREAFLAYLADEWLIPCMLPLMDSKVHFGVIPLHTALMGASVFVCHLVRSVFS